jgi:hypothetical protein
MSTLTAALRPRDTQLPSAGEPATLRHLHAVADDAPAVPGASSQIEPARRRPAVRSTATGAQFDPLLEFDAWRQMGTRLGVYTSATSWWLGDWLTFGRDKYGRRYKEAIAATGLDYQTLRNYAVVARRFAAPRRRANLTFQHHAVVCSLPDDRQDEWLDRATAGGWSRNELRRRLREAVTDREPAQEIISLAVARKQADLWRRAAERGQCALESWILAVLDAAAGPFLASGKV